MIHDLGRSIFAILYQEALWLHMDKTPLTAKKNLISAFQENKCWMIQPLAERIRTTPSAIGSAIPVPKLRSYFKHVFPTMGNGKNAWNKSIPKSIATARACGFTGI